MVQYACKLFTDTDLVERKSYTVSGKLVSFKVCLIAGDMKWLADFAGELVMQLTFLTLQMGTVVIRTQLVAPLVMGTSSCGSHGSTMIVSQ